MSRREKFIDGCRKGIPITFGYVPMGIGYAAIAIKAGMTPLQTVSMSVLVYAGAGQIIAASMLLSGATGDYIDQFCGQLKVFCNVNLCLEPG